MLNPLELMLITFVLVVLTFPFYINFLKKLSFGKQIRPEGPDSHYTKVGTPTMGGAPLVFIVAALTLLFNFNTLQTMIPLFTLITMGFLGMMDDVLNAKTGFGVKARQKLVWQVLVALAGVIYIQRHFDITQIKVPYLGIWEIGQVGFIILAVIAIVGTSNGVNLTDGLDGLAGGTLIFAFLAYCLIAVFNNQVYLAGFCACIIGGLIGFLWFNVHPADIFMGDSGSLALGATLGVVAIMTLQIAVLPIIGFVFLIETLSLILQVASFKTTGKRIFKMSPLHHHFELIGWPEERVTLRFWLIGALAGAIGLSLALVSMGEW